MAKTKHILSENELSAFCEQISMIISAGLPIYYGVSILRDEACDEETKSLLDEIYTPMELEQHYIQRYQIPVYFLTICLIWYS